MQLSRLVYRSKTSWDILTNEILRSLAICSARRNAKHDITGLLVLSDETFLQVLEGPAAAVNQLYANIINDQLHREVRLLSYEEISQRTFEDWSMRVVDLNDLPQPSRDILRRKYDDTDGYVHIPGDANRAIALLFDAQAMCRAESGAL